MITYDSYNVAAQNLGGFVSIFAPNKKTDIISMSTITSDPDFGKKLLSTIIDNYNWLRNDQLAETQRDNLEFVENRLVTLETELNDAQTAVQQFKEKNKITEPAPPHPCLSTKQPPSTARLPAPRHIMKFCA